MGTKIFPLNSLDISLRTDTHYFSENVVAPGIEPGPLDLKPGTVTTRPQRWSTFFYIT
jgi:hypothetical protein